MARFGETRVKRIFLAGIIQGSLAEPAIHNQDYRGRIKALLARFLPGVRVYCPITAHPNSLSYDDRKGRRVFLRHIALARDSDLVVAYLPAASMGTAVELWEANRRGTPIIAITPLALNWAIRYLCDVVVADLDEFAEACRDGRVARLLDSPPNRRRAFARRSTSRCSTGTRRRAARTR